MKTQRILLLDDDPTLLRALSELLEENSYQVSAALNVARAIATLSSNPDFAIVDLFLAGDKGDALSNDFIRDHLVPRKIPYGRLTSAPRLVPKEYSGEWVLDKRLVATSPQTLIAALLQVF